MILEMKKARFPYLLIFSVVFWRVVEVDGIRKIEESFFAKKVLLLFSRTT